jgi:hypothetical protein
VKKYVKGTTMLTPKRFLTMPFACGVPAAMAAQRGRSEFIQNAEIASLTATSA